MLGVLLAALCCLSGCGMCNRSNAIAEITKTDGPVERQANNEASWGAAAVGSKYFLGDAAKTGDKSTAELVISGGAVIGMQPNTVLRFGGKAGQSRISVELGEIDLSGTGSYGLGFGDVNLSNGKVRIKANKDGTADVTLTLGAAEVTTLKGETKKLVLDQKLEIGDDIGIETLKDAGVPDAPPPVDAAPEPDAPPASPSGATVTITGPKGEMQKPGETKYTPLPAGEHELPAGAKVRVGRATTATLVAGGTTLELAGASAATFTDKATLVMETGSGKLTGEGSLELPGGAIAIKTEKNVPSEVGLGTGGGGMKVTINRGSGKLTGTGGSQLDMARGESATLMKNGTIRPLEAIPTYFDFRITAGEGNFTIHDPRPPTAVQFQFAGKCPDGGIIEMDRNQGFRTAKVSAGKDFANHLVKTGGWYYRLRCTSGGTEGKPVASGLIVVSGDGGTRALPKQQGVSPFEPNGMTWKIGYQSVIPDLAVTFPGGGTNFTLHLGREGKEQTFVGGKKLKVDGKKLADGNYTYWFDRDGVTQDKRGSLKIEFDNTAPQVYIELPVNGRAWPAGDIDVKGAVLPGWSAALDTPIPIDGARRFIAKAGHPPGNALAIKLSHPQRGVHYYLRREK